jgi:hypothetical protein
MISKEQLKQQALEIREAANNFLVSRATLRHKTGETSVRGQVTPVYTEKEIDIRIITKSGDSRTNVAAQERLTQLTTFTGVYRAQIATDENVVEGDIILYTDATNSKVHTYSVVTVPATHEFTGARIIVIKEVI